MSGKNLLCDALFERIVQVVEPVTRFDRGSLQRSAEEERTSAGAAKWHHTVRFLRNSVEHAGRLPSAIRNEGSMQQLTAAMVEVERRCTAEMPLRLRAWMDTHAQDFTPLEPSAVFDGPFVRGFEHACGTCSGSGRVTCHGCGGRGDNQCTNCGGTTRVNCFSCGGRGQQSCGQCGGRGQWQEQKSRQAYNYSNNSSYTEYYTEWHRCFGCGGSGTQNCSNCSGSGKTHCYQCSNGRVTCGTCNGHGTLTCGSCGGTGRQHTLQEVSCRVDAAFTAAVQDDRDEVRKQAAAVSMRDLHTLAPLAFQRAETGDAHALRAYTFALRTASVTAGVGQATRTIIGYGPAAHVYDMKGLVSVLLMGDLEELERNLKAAGRFSFGRAPQLAEALDLAFLSEAHVLIAKHPYEGKGILPKELAAVAITGEHATRFTKAVRASLQRLIKARLLKGWLAVVLLPALLLLIGMRTDQQLRWTLGITFGVLVFSGLLWRWLVERPAINGLGKRYALVGVKGMREIAKATRATRLWRRTGPWLALALLAGSVYITGTPERVMEAARNTLYGIRPELKPPPPEDPVQGFMYARLVYNQDSPGIRSYFDTLAVKGDTLRMPDGGLPDVSMRPQPDRKKEWTAILRCQWLPLIDAPILLGTEEGLKVLPAFEKKYRTKCYVLIGAGGTPRQPLAVYLIPLTAKSPVQLQPAELAAYDTRMDYRAVRFNRFKGRMGN